MKATILLVALAVPGWTTAAALDVRAACNADNCLRAVRGRLPSAAADCSSYLSTTTTTTTATIIAATATTTLPVTTVSATRYSVVGGSVITPGPDPPPYEMALRKRGLAERDAGTIPTYATACSGAVRYSSACSCVGVTAQTSTVTATTAATATSTAYASTATAYTTLGVCDAAKNYGLQYDSLSTSSPRGTTQHYYVHVPAANGRDCCAACFRAKGCNVFEYFVMDDGTPNCSFYIAVDGPVTDPSSATCPYGQSLLQGPKGSVLAPGPCALGPCREVQDPDGYTHCA